MDLTQEQILGIGVVVVVLVVSLIYLFGSEKKKIALDPENWQAFPLTEIFQISHDVKKYRLYYFYFSSYSSI